MMIPTNRIMRAENPTFFVLLAFLLIHNFHRADEGMWLLPKIDNYNIEKIQSLGGRITAEEIFSNKKSSLSDAVVNVGNVGSGSVVSPQGLVLTNHHVIYDHIQRISTTDNDYLKEGFWASSLDDEIPAEGLTVTFLKKILDVTEEVQLEVRTREEQGDPVSMRAIGRDISSAYTKDNGYQGFLSNHFRGDKYYLYVYEVFTDIRFAGFPPSSVGKFGGLQDNFRWPRHTGDFGFIRVYADQDGRPADYSKDNVPLEADRYLEIEAGGVSESDFAMVMGYPGSSQRYLTSSQIEDQMKVTHPGRIAARSRRLDIIREAMRNDDEVRIKYASKYFNSANGMQLSKGQLEQLERHDVPAMKQAEEKEFMEWVRECPDRYEKFGGVLEMIRQSVEEKRETAYAHHLLNEALLMGTEIYVAGIRANVFLRNLSEDMSRNELLEASEGFYDRQKNFFQDYSKSVDQRVVAKMMNLVRDKLPAHHLPEIFQYADEEFGGDYSLFAEALFQNSVFTCPDRLADFCFNPDLTDISDDLLIRYSVSIYEKAIELRNINNDLSEGEREGSRMYMKALREKYDGKPMYPDANFTMRMTYGNVLGYSPQDAVYKGYKTYLGGVIEKRDPDDSDFRVPEKLVELYNKARFGKYGNDRMPVNFITNNDITGGNSGSPVVDHDGKLVGVAFCGNWESLAADVVFLPEQSRAINVDIRYVLFITDKLAGSSHIMQELSIVGL